MPLIKILLLLATFGLALAQNPSWPPKLEPGQTWLVVIGNTSWIVRLGAAQNGVYSAKAEGPNAREAQVGFFTRFAIGQTRNSPGTVFQNVLVFDFKASPEGPGFNCILSSLSEGSARFENNPTAASFTPCRAVLQVASARPAWPPRLEPGQVWNFTLEAQGQRFAWNVRLGAAQNGAFEAQAQGVDTRPAQVAYFADTLPGTSYKNVLVFDFKAPTTPSSFASPFTCLIQPDGKGTVALAGVPCSATLGSASSGTSGAAGAPTWLKEARKEPVAGQVWRLEAFNVAWSLTLSKPESDGFSGTARMVENRSGDPLPADWAFRLTYVGRTVRLDVSAGQAIVSCLLEEQYQNAVDGVLRGEANLYSQGQQGSRGQAGCRVVLSTR
jgi:hypothetical protein